MREPITVEVRPIGEDKKHARRLLWTGLGIIAFGIIILLVPQFLNLIIAGVIILFGCLQLLVIKWQGRIFNRTTGWTTIGFGLLVLFFPQLLNYLLIFLFIVLNIVFIIFFISIEGKIWAAILIGIALLGGVFMLAFPMAINIVFAVYLIIAGSEQLLLSYQSYYRWQWFH